LNAKIIIIIISSSSGGDGNSIVTGKPGKPSRPDLKVERRLIPASLGLKFVGKRTRFFSLLPGTESYNMQRELLAKKISPAK